MLYTCVARSIYYFIIAIRLVFFFHPLRGNARVQKSGAIWSDRTFRRGTSTVDCLGGFVHLTVSARSIASIPQI